MFRTSICQKKTKARKVLELVNPSVPDEENAPDGFTVAPEKPTEEPGLGGSSRIALYAGLAFFAAFTLFAVFAPISGGAIASGVISPEGRRQVVQHLEGGIIDLQDQTPFKVVTEAAG